MVEIIGKIQIGEKYLCGTSHTDALQEAVKEMDHPIRGGCQIAERSVEYGEEW